MDSEDRDIVERVLEGRSQAFEALVRKYARLAGSIAYGILGDFDLAEDVVQDSFLRAYRSLGGLRSSERFRVWLCGIVRKRAIDVLRRETTRRTAHLPSDDAAIGARSALPSPDEIFAREEERRRVFAVLDELSEEDRTVLALKHMDGLSYKEIADATTTSVSAVESRLFRARKVFREKLERRVRNHDVPGEPGR